MVVVAKERELRLGVVNTPAYTAVAQACGYARSFWSPECADSVAYFLMWEHGSAVCCGKEVRTKLEKTTVSAGDTIALVVDRVLPNTASLEVFVAEECVATLKLPEHWTDLTFAVQFCSHGDALHVTDVNTPNRINKAVDVSRITKEQHTATIAKLSETNLDLPHLVLRADSAAAGEVPIEEVDPTFGGLFFAGLPIPATLEAAFAQLPAQDAYIAQAKECDTRALDVLIPGHLKHAITLYTMGPAGLHDNACSRLVADGLQSSSIESAPFYLLNKALRTGIAAHIEPWRDYVWLLLHALNHLPAAKEQTLFRAMKLPAKMIAQDYQATNEFLWRGFTSTSVELNPLKQFMERRGGVHQGEYELVHVCSI